MGIIWGWLLRGPTTIFPMIEGGVGWPVMISSFDDLGHLDEGWSPVTMKKKLMKSSMGWRKWSPLQIQGTRKVYFPTFGLMFMVNVGKYTMDPMVYGFHYLLDMCLRTCSKFICFWRGMVPSKWKRKMIPSRRKASTKNTVFCFLSGFLIQQGKQLGSK